MSNPLAVLAKRGRDAGEQADAISGLIAASALSHPSLFDGTATVTWTHPRSFNSPLDTTPSNVHSPDIMGRRCVRLRMPPMAAMVLVSMAMAACGSADSPIAIGDQTASPARTSSPTSSGTSPSPAWKTYRSAKWGYTVIYPEAWLDLPNFGAPDSEKYFSNENVGSVRELDSSGVFFAISVNAKIGEVCPYHERATTEISRQLDVTVDGNAAKLDVVDSQADFELYIVHDGYCYRFVYFFRSLMTRDATQDTAIRMLSGFRFGLTPTT